MIFQSTGKGAMAKAFERFEGLGKVKKACVYENDYSMTVSTPDGEPPRAAKSVSWRKSALRPLASLLRTLFKNRATVAADHVRRG